MAHPVDRPLEDRDLSAEPERDDRRVVADDPAADHDHFPRCNAWNTAEQEPAAAERLLEEVRAGLRREPTRDLRHRSEQRQRAARGLDRLICHGRHPESASARVSGSSAAMWR